MDSVLVCDKVQYFRLQKVYSGMETKREYREFTRSKKDMLMNLLITLLVKKKK